MSLGWAIITRIVIPLIAVDSGQIPNDCWKLFFKNIYIIKTTTVNWYFNNLLYLYRIMNWVWYLLDYRNLYIIINLVWNLNFLIDRYINVLKNIVLK
jgi:hypothetical protein